MMTVVMMAVAVALMVVLVMMMMMMMEAGKTGAVLVAGGKVYMACRSMEQAAATADDIKRQTGVDDNRLVVMQLDLSSLSSVRSFANSFKTSTCLSCLHF